MTKRPISRGYFWAGNFFKRAYNAHNGAAASTDIALEVVSSEIYPFIAWYWNRRDGAYKIVLALGLLPGFGLNRILGLSNTHYQWRLLR